MATASISSRSRTKATIHERRSCARSGDSRKASMRRAGSRQRGAAASSPGGQQLGARQHARLQSAQQVEVHPLAELDAVIQRRQPAQLGEAGLLRRARELGDIVAWREGPLARRATGPLSPGVGRIGWPGENIPPPSAIAAVSAVSAVSQAPPHAAPASPRSPPPPSRQSPPPAVSAASRTPLSLHQRRALQRRRPFSECSARRDGAATDGVGQVVAENGQELWLCLWSHLQACYMSGA